jgi:hypothetical protein
MGIPVDISIIVRSPHYQSFHYILLLVVDAVEPDIFIFHLWFFTLELGPNGSGSGSGSV